MVNSYRPNALTTARMNTASLAPSSSPMFRVQQAAMTTHAFFYTSMLDMLRYMGRFTVINLTHHLMATNPHIPRPVIDRFVGDAVSQFRDNIDPYDDERDHHDAPLTREQTMRKLRDMTTNVRVIDLD